MFKLVSKIIYILNKKQRKRLLKLQLLVVISALLEVISIGLITPFISFISSLNKTNENFLLKILNYLGIAINIQNITLLGFLIICIVIISAFLSILTIKKLSNFAAQTGTEIANNLFTDYLNEDYVFHTKINTSHLIKQIATETSRVTDNILQPFMQINARLLVIILISISAFIYNPVICLIGILIFSISYFLLFFLVKNKLNENGIQITYASRERFKIMNESFGAIKEISVLNVKNQFIQNFEKVGETFAKSYASSNTIYNAPKFVMECVLYTILITIGIFTVATTTSNADNYIEQLLFFGIVGLKILPSFQQIYGNSAQIKSNLSALDEISNDLKNARSNNRLSINSNKENNLEGDLRLSNIVYQYDEDDAKAIDNISIIIEKNQKIALIGKSGSGKSTLLDIMLGLLEPKEGYLKVGDSIITKENMLEWQSSIGYVPQNIFLIDGSILENIGFGLEKDKINEDKVKKAIELSQLTDWIASLPDGLNTQVGERGVQISGGQKQRIGIARALYNDVNYLFMDEATSALDTVTETAIMESIDKLSESKTIIVIAHRLNTVKNCDCIYLMSKGKIIDSGSYSDLLQTNDDFRAMVGNKNE